MYSYIGDKKKWQKPFFIPPGFMCVFVLADSGFSFVAFVNVNKMRGSCADGIAWRW